MRQKTRGSSGFTLIELMVVVLIIGILAAFAIPSYIKSVENSKAQDAVALMNMVATTNRMYALDHPSAGGANGGYVSGQLTTACGTVACAGLGSASPNPPCELVACKYLAAQDFDTQSYVVAADYALTANAACNAGQFTTDALACPAGGCVACAARRSGVPPGTNIPPYNTWSYGVNTAGQMTSSGGAPGAVSP